MREGYDGSGVGILLRDLGGPFQEMKNAPILSGIYSNDGLKRLDQFMLRTGFTTKYKVTFKLPSQPPADVPKRDVYLVRAYDAPAEYEQMDADQRGRQYMQMRLALKKMGRERNDMIVFSFWPDTIMIKEIGDPLVLADYLVLDRKTLNARVILAQGRQNTNYAIDLYACHPFFLQGYATMTNGENTAFVPNREFLSSRGFEGYNGYQSDSEVFTHILHYTLMQLGLDLSAYKHVITPLDHSQLDSHPDKTFLTHLKHACRPLVIDGPNCVVGCLPDHTLIMAQDSKKLRPGVVGGRPGKYGFASEVCGLDAAIPERDQRQDFQPMHLDTVAVGPSRDGISVFNQRDPLLYN